MKRQFISIYFPYKKSKRKKHETVSIAFGKNEKKLYHKVKSITTTEIKKIISIFSYEQLINTAEKEHRRPTELIKLRLKQRLLKSDNKKIKTVKYSPEKIKYWIKKLEKNKGNKELINFLKGMIDKDE